MMDQPMETSKPEEGLPPTKETPATEENGSGSWLSYAIQGASVLLIVLVALAVYHFTVVLPNKQRIAVVDIGEVLSIKELQVTIAALSPETPDSKGQAAAFDEITRFAKDIEAVLAELQQECGCTLLVKSAVVRPAPGEDLTPLLKQRLGIDKLDQAQLGKQLSELGAKGAPPLLEGSKK